MNKKILEILNKVKIVLTDVDGVLTNGGVYYTNEGMEIEKFHTRDGMGVELLLKNKIPTIVMADEISKSVQQRAKKIQVTKIYFSNNKKEDRLIEICKYFKLKPEEIAYIGDDLNDVNIMKKVGFIATPNDGMKIVKDISNYICKCKGGEGVLREVADLIIYSKSLK